MLQESDLIPYHLSPPPGERVVVIAPHPDDETFGCGGTLRLLSEQGRSIKVLFLTSGDKGDPENRDAPLDPSVPREKRFTRYSLMREKEAEKALRVLGISDCEFLRFPDRGVHEQYGAVYEEIKQKVTAFVPDTVYVPSMVELNPDHRSAAALALALQNDRAKEPTGGGGQPPLKIVFYEVLVPLRPNLLVDVTTVYRKKKKAMKKYASQQKTVDYSGYMEALNSMRTMTVQGARHVEAFWAISRPLSHEAVKEWLSYYGPCTSDANEARGRDHQPGGNPGYGKNSTA